MVFTGVPAVVDTWLVCEMPYPPYKNSLTKWWFCIHTLFGVGRGGGGVGGNPPPIPVHDAITISSITLCREMSSRLEPPGLSKKDSKYQMAFF